MSTNNLILLLTETFEPPEAPDGFSYSDEGASLQETLDELSSMDASTPTVSGGTTIAGHAEHLRFFLHFVHERMKGSTEVPDWDESWRVREVTPAEWASLKSDVHHAYEGLKAYLRTTETLAEINERRAMAIVVHTAYHVGAIRQMMKSVRG